ncbi:MAG TPA: hypothetical protein VNL14_08740 [Candidatus Acidoferrales bacterium]|nr:hypothetical protein [Candidatus Acidoferrales bacterium]
MGIAEPIPTKMEGLHPSSENSQLKVADAERESIEDLEWRTVAREDPDPSLRVSALESWARNSGETLDPVTHALVDPDESVRQRALELFEEALARR